MLSIKELADKIRPHVDLTFSQKAHPDRQHLHATAVAVASELGMDPNALNIGHLTGLLVEHVTAPSREYPKMKYHHGERKEQIVENAEQEHALGDGWVDHRWEGK